MRYEKISIPNPCNEDWNKMDLKGNGRYCDSCNKVVVDFTIMTDQEILNYLSNKRGVCGHFHISQVKQPLIHKFLIGIQEYFQQKFSSHLIRNSVLAVIGLLMLISGCQRSTTGAFEPGKNHSTKGRVKNIRLTGKVRRIDLK